jgi:hypothetical protein
MAIATPLGSEPLPEVVGTTSGVTRGHHEIHFGVA